MRNLVFPLYCLSILIIFSCTDQPVRFERLYAEYSGINFSNDIIDNDSFNILNNEYMYNGGGVGVGDLNNDGLQDLVFTGNKVSSRIYLNLGNLKFEDITNQFEEISNGQWFSGVSLVDINNDDWLDIYLTATMHEDGLMRKNRLWINQGGEMPGFKEMAESYGIADTGYSVHAGFLDYDLDGDLDLYVLNNTFNSNVPTNYRPKIVDGTAANNDRLYKNTGNGFVDATVAAGITYEGFGLGVAFGDVNKDGYPDIYVSNDYIANDLLYINQGDGTFKNSSENYLSYHSKFSMGNDMSDFNNDGNPDIITLDMMPEKYPRKKQTINGNSYVMYINDERYDYQHQYIRNMLHVHNGFLNGEMLPFSETGQMAGVYQTEWSWSPLFADFDNDGDRDLMITNGFPKDLTDKDFTNYKAEVHGSVATDKHVISRIPVVKVSNYAYENTDGHAFSNVTTVWGLDQPSFSNGAAFADLDNDGDLDYVVNNINDQAFIYENHSIGKLDDNMNFLRILLKGEGLNSQAVGAKVSLWSNGKFQFYEHFLSRGYISSVDPVIHFGLGGEDKIDSLQVVWPRQNRVTTLKQVHANKTLTLYEKEADLVKSPLRTPKAFNFLFNKKDKLLEYIHKEKDYIDFFQNQNILQHKFSQIGPCMAKGDLNGDGKDDILIGASNDAPTTAFIRGEDGFIQTELPGLTGKKGCHESDLVILDIDGDRDSDVVVVAGGYAVEDQQKYRHFVFENTGQSFSRSSLPLPPFPASVVRPFDFDHDGDQDLFIGARVKKGMFPLADSSYILINDGGKFIFDANHSYSLGMVTDAVWSDFNGDGWKDVVIAREWNSVAVLQNDGGKGFTEIGGKQLTSKHGAWSAIVAGDFDGNGYEDYLVGNMGDNNRFPVSDQYPMRLYAVDIDKNGTIDPLVSAYWSDKEGVMQEYPINYLDELASQSPFFKKRFTSYTSFSYSRISDFMDLETVPEEQIFKMNSLSSYILWNDGGKITWEKLPPAVQTAPVREMLIEDFNGDAYPDVLVAGNDYTYDLSTGYFDANKGIVLLGNGSRFFEVLPPSRSGLLLCGQIESLLYLKGDTSLLVAGVNRDKVLVYKNLK